jgi:hypothetical protein
VAIRLPRVDVEAAEVIRERTARHSDKGSGPKGAKGRGEGRGAKASPRKITERVFRIGGAKVTFENRKGLDAESIRALLVAALGQLDEGQGAEAA